MRKGFTLIEAAVAAALVGILISTQATALSRYMRIYNSCAAESSETFYAEEAFFYLGYITEHSASVKAGNGVIELVRRDGAGSDWIRMDRDGDLVISYGSCWSGTTNNIMKGIEAFEAKQRGLVLFITIRTKKGNEYNKCIMLYVEKEEASCLFTHFS
ncbi:MAG TPA: type II secretion system protein [Clostridiaceae bacterium]|nr:type II secretion system protein [Clostridiaceae bacterium]